MKKRTTPPRRSGPHRATPFAAPAGITTRAAPPPSVSRPAPPPVAPDPAEGVRLDLPQRSRKRGQGELLTNAEIAAWDGFAETGSAAKLRDGNGLYLHQRTLGGQKVFRLRLRVDGHRKKEEITLGTFPSLSLEAAREAADGARVLANQGISPNTLRKVDALNARLDERALFGTIADLYWTAHAEAEFWDAKYAKEVRGHLDNHIKPHLLWRTPMGTASAPVAIGLIERCAQNSVSIAYKVLALVRAVTNHAIEIGCIDSSPLSALKPSARIRKYRQDVKAGRRNYPAILELDRLGRILRDNDNSPACFQVRLCTILLAHTALRVSNAVALKWDWVDLEHAVISIPRDPGAMKNDDLGTTASDRGLRAFFDLPIPARIVAMLRKLEPQSEFVFFSPYNKSTHITGETMEKHFREGLGLAGLHSPHSWRSAFSTWANAQTTPDGRRRFDANDIELCLDHRVGSSVSQAYNRGVAIARLRPIFDAWADALESAQLTLISAGNPRNGGAEDFERDMQEQAQREEGARAKGPVRSSPCARRRVRVSVRCVRTRTRHHPTHRKGD